MNETVELRFLWTSAPGSPDNGADGTEIEHQILSKAWTLWVAPLGGAGDRKRVGTKITGTLRLERVLDLNCATRLPREDGPQSRAAPAPVHTGRWLLADRGDSDPVAKVAVDHRSIGSFLLGGMGHRQAVVPVRDPVRRARYPSSFSLKGSPQADR